MDTGMDASTLNSILDTLRETGRFRECADLLQRLQYLRRVELCSWALYRATTVGPIDCTTPIGAFLDFKNALEAL